MCTVYPVSSRIWQFLVSSDKIKFDLFESLTQADFDFLYQLHHDTFEGIEAILKQIYPIPVNINIL